MIYLPISHEYQIFDKKLLMFLKENATMDKLTASHRIKLSNAYWALGLDGAQEAMYVRKSLKLLLAELIEILPQGLGVMVLDGYRNLQTSVAIFEKIKQQLELQYPECNVQEIEQKTRQFCAHPFDKGHYAVPPHQSGGAVDLCLFDLNSGLMLNYGTEFDDLSHLAQSDFFEQDFCADYGLSEALWLEIRQNRRQLFHYMGKLGFTNYAQEWWHFDLGDCLWAKYRQCDWFYPVAELMD